MYSTIRSLHLEAGIGIRPAPSSNACYPPSVPCAELSPLGHPFQAFYAESVMQDKREPFLKEERTLIFVFSSQRPPPPPSPKACEYSAAFQMLLFACPLPPQTRMYRAGKLTLCHSVRSRSGCTSATATDVIPASK